MYIYTCIIKAMGLQQITCITLLGLFAAYDSIDRPNCIQVSTVFLKVLFLALSPSFYIPPLL